MKILRLLWITVFVISGMFYAQADNVIQINDVETTVGEVITVEVDLDNDSLVVGFQFDVPIPAGFTFVDDSEQLTSRATGSHSLSQSIIGDNIRFLCFSFPTTPFTGNSGLIMTFQMVASSTPGTYPLEVEGAILSDPAGINVLTGTIDGEVEVLTGINILQLIDTSQTAGSPVTVDMAISNTQEFVGFQADIALPSGFDYVPGSIVLDPARADNHQIVATIIGANTLRVLSYSLSNAIFSGSEGVVASFDLSTPNTPGDFDITIISGVISDALANNIITGTDDGVITLYPQVLCPDDFGVCIDDAPWTLFGGTPEGGTYTGTGVTDNVFDPVVAGLGDHVITYTYTYSNGVTDFCDFTITVNDLPVVTCPADDEVCVDADAYSLTGGLPEGGTYTGTGVAGGVFDPLAAGVGAHQITYTYADDNGCENFCAYTITVNDLPVVTCPDDFEVCIDDDPWTLFGATPAGGDYTGTGVTNNMFDPVDAGLGDHVITYTYADDNGCVNSCAFSITVNDLPVVTCPEGDEMCVDAPAYSLTGGMPEGGTYSGTGVASGSFDPAVAGPGAHIVTYTYADDNGCENSCDFTMTVFDLPVVTCPDDFDVCVDAEPWDLFGGTPTGGIYSGTGVTDGTFDPVAAGLGDHLITYTFTDDNGCTNFCEFTITVNDLPVVTCPDDFIVCVNADLVELTGGMPEGGTYSGTGVNDGWFDPGVAGAGDHIITYTYTDGNGCINFCEFTITVNFVPDVTCPPDMSVCESDDSFELTGATPAGGTYSGPGVVNGVFDPLLTGMGTYTITYTFTDPSGCTASCDFSITVDESFVANVFIYASAYEVCIGNAVTLTATPTNGGQDPSYQWKRNGSNVGSNSPTYTYIPSNGDNIVCIMTSSLVCAFNNPAQSNIIVLTVSPTVTVTAQISADPEMVCEGDEMEFTATTTNGGDDPMYEWYVNGVAQGVNLATFSYIPVDGDAVYLEFTSSLLCTNENPVMSNTIDAAVNPLPIVVWESFEDTLCENYDPVTLTGGMPPGGEYSGPGVSGGMFDPGEAGLGEHILTYTYTDEFGCVNSAEYTVFVDICTGIIENLNENSFTIYPNPALDNKLFIRYNGVNAELNQIEMYNSQGVMVRFIEEPEIVNTLELDLYGVKPGVYYIHFVVDNGTITKKVVIM